MGHINQIFFDLEKRGYTLLQEISDITKLEPLIRQLHESKKEVIILTNPYEESNSGKILYEIYTHDINQPETHGPFVNFGG